MTELWLNGNGIAGDSAGNLIDCAVCPCQGEGGLVGCCAGGLVRWPAVLYAQLVGSSEPPLVLNYVGVGLYGLGSVIYATTTTQTLCGVTYGPYGGAFPPPFILFNHGISSPLGCQFEVEPFSEEIFAVWDCNFPINLLFTVSWPPSEPCPHNQILVYST